MRPPGLRPELDERTSFDHAQHAPVGDRRLAARIGDHPPRRPRASIASTSPARSGPLPRPVRRRAPPDRSSRRAPPRRPRRTACAPWDDARSAGSPRCRDRADAPRSACAGNRIETSRVQSLHARRCVARSIDREPGGLVEDDRLAVDEENKIGQHRGPVPRWPRCRKFGKGKVTRALLGVNLFPSFL